MKTRRQLLAAAGTAFAVPTVVSAQEEAFAEPEVTFHDCQSFTVEYEGQYRCLVDLFLLINDPDEHPPGNYGEDTYKALTDYVGCGEETFSMDELWDSDFFYIGPVITSVQVEYFELGDEIYEQYQNPDLEQCHDALYDEWDAAHPGNGSDENGDDEPPDENGDDDTDGNGDDDTGENGTDEPPDENGGSDDGDDGTNNGDDSTTGNGGSSDGSDQNGNGNDDTAADEMNGFGVGAAITAIGGALGIKRYLSRRDSDDR